MPLLVVHNLHRNDFSDGTRFVGGLKIAVAGVPELKIKESDVEVSINQGAVDGYNQTIVVIVELLFDRPERTLEVRQQLARSICKYIKEYFCLRSYKVKVVVKRFDPEKDVIYSK